MMYDGHDDSSSSASEVGGERSRSVSSSRAPLSEAEVSDVGDQGIDPPNLQKKGPLKKPPSGKKKKGWSKFKNAISIQKTSKNASKARSQSKFQNVDDKNLIEDKSEITNPPIRRTSPFISSDSVPHEESAMTSEILGDTIQEAQIKSLNDSTSRRADLDEQLKPSIDSSLRRIPGEELKLIKNVSMTEDLSKIEYLIKCFRAVEADSKEMKVLQKIGGGDTLAKSLDDIADDLEQYEQQILEVEDIPDVHRASERLAQTVQGVGDLLEKIRTTRLMGNKNRFRRKLTFLIDELTKNGNGLISAVSMAHALKHPEQPTIMVEPPPPPESESEPEDEEEDPGPTPEELALEAKKRQQEEAQQWCIQGDRCYFGRGTSRNWAQALDFYLKSAEAGNLDGMLMTATMYKEGQAVEKDIDVAKEWIGKAIELGSVEAMYSMGVLLSQESDQKERQISNLGSSLEAVSKLEDEIASLKEKALGLFECAAKEGHRDAKFDLALGCQALGRLEDARRWFQVASKSGDPRAQNHLGMAYFGDSVSTAPSSPRKQKNGSLGLGRDYEQAALWFQKSANQGHRPAQHNLGLCYEQGLGVSKNLAHAATLYREACEDGKGGSPQAACSLAYLLARSALPVLLQEKTRLSNKNQYAECFSVLVPGSIPTAENLGGMRDECQESAAVSEAREDLQEAVLLFRRAADAGVAEAAFQLGRLYHQGLGVPFDPGAALANYQAAAKAGHCAAAFHAGNMVYTGVGGTKDPKVAAQYYTLAAEGGNPDGQNALGILYEEARGVPHDAKRAKELYEAAAIQGHADAAFNLGLAIERGQVQVTGAEAGALAGYRVVAPGKPEESLKWFKEALRLGHPHAHQEVERMSLRIRLGDRSVQLHQQPQQNTDGTKNQKGQDFTSDDTISS